MKFLGFEIRKAEDIEERSGVFDSLLYNGKGSYLANKAMLLSTVYRCVDVISDSVALLPIEPYYIDDKGYKSKFTKHPTYYLLNKEPNPNMSRFTFIKTLVVSTLLNGNGYAYIQRDQKGDAVSLHYVPFEYVTIHKQTDGTLKYSVVGIKGLVEACNMIHILNFSYDGIEGISTLRHARLTLGLASDAESHASGFFKGGANLSGILKVQSNLTDKQKTALKTSWQTAFSPATGLPNGVAVLEGNMDYTPVTVNPVDAQLLETRQFNVVDICRFFGVSPVKAFDLSHSSYSTVEATLLAFLTDTLAPLLEKIELEFERKLYKPSERSNVDVRFDTSTLLRADKASLADYYNKLFYMGAMSVNEIRQSLDLPAIEGGEKHFLLVNLLTMDNAINNVKNDTQNTEESGFSDKSNA